jgi:phage tail protein X
MSQFYRTRTGDMIDAICFHYYDGMQSEAVELVYEANRGLADQGPVLPSGLIIELPELPAADATPTVKLWD